MATNESRAGGISRRRVLAGTAWATPAVVVGLSAPPAAASGEVPGVSGSVTGSEPKTVNFDITPDPANSPLTNIYATITIIAQNKNAALSTPSGWQFVSGPTSVPQGGDTLVYVFLYPGPASTTVSGTSFAAHSADVVSLAVQATSPDGTVNETYQF